MIYLDRLALVVSPEMDDLRITNKIQPYSTTPHPTLRQSNPMLDNIASSISLAWLSMSKPVHPQPDTAF